MSLYLSTHDARYPSGRTISIYIYIYIYIYICSSLINMYIRISYMDMYMHRHTSLLVSVRCPIPSERTLTVPHTLGICIYTNYIYIKTYQYIYIYLSVYIYTYQHMSLLVNIRCASARTSTAPHTLGAPQYIYL